MSDAQPRYGVNAAGQIVRNADSTHLTVEDAAERLTSLEEQYERLTQRPEWVTCDYQPEKREDDPGGRSCTEAINFYANELAGLKEQLEAARSALEFYADEKTWTQPTSWGGRIIDDEGPWLSDTGKRARDVLYPAPSLTCGKCGRSITDAESQWGWCPECAAADPDFLGEYGSSPSSRSEP